MNLPEARSVDLCPRLERQLLGMRRCAGLLLLAPSMLVIGAASPTVVSAVPLQVQISDSGPLGGVPAPAPTAPSPKMLVATPAGLEPAPVPNPDAGGPADAGGIRGASLAPAFFSQKAEFAGDGYVGNSSADNTEERRRQPAAGLGLSIPVQQ